MKRIINSILPIIIVALLLLNGCQNSNENIEALQKENEQLKQQIQEIAEEPSGEVSEESNEITEQMDDTKHTVKIEDGGSSVTFGNTEHIAKITGASVVFSPRLNEYILKIDFHYTNKSNTASNFINDIYCNVIAYQDGIELDTPGFTSEIDIYDTNDSYKNIKATEIDAQLAFILNNTSSNIDLELGSDYYSSLITTKIVFSGNDALETAKKESITETTYNKAISLTKSDLTGSKGNWSYNGLKLLSDDCEWIDSPLNKTGTVNQGAVYRKIAKVLWGSDWENRRFLYKYSSISELLLGFIPDTVDDYIPLGKNASEFIVEKEQIKAIMQKLETINVVQGNFDFDYGKFGKYDVEISDVKSCAKEMQISEEMLGYVIAMLAEYTSDISFNGNICHIGFESPSIQ